ncbi:MAG: hypothetical protein ABW184_09940 [Sphingobium sp.]
MNPLDRRLRALEAQAPKSFAPEFDCDLSALSDDQRAMVEAALNGPQPIVAESLPLATQRAFARIRLPSE